MISTINNLKICNAFGVIALAEQQSIGVARPRQRHLSVFFAGIKACATASPTFRWVATSWIPIRIEAVGALHRFRECTCSITVPTNRLRNVVGTINQYSDVPLSTTFCACFVSVTQARAITALFELTADWTIQWFLITILTSRATLMLKHSRHCRKLSCE